jgi:hypothetical protein
LVFEYISEHIFKPYFTQLTWLCLDVCDVGFRSRSQVLLWNMNSKLVPSIGPDAPEAVSVLRQIRDRKLIHFIRVRSVSNGLSGQFGWDGPSARQRHMHRLKKTFCILLDCKIGSPCVKLYQPPMIFTGVGCEDHCVQVVSDTGHDTFRFCERPNQDSNGWAHPLPG